MLLLLMRLSAGEYVVHWYLVVVEDVGPRRTCEACREERIFDWRLVGINQVLEVQCLCRLIEERIV